MHEKKTKYRFEQLQGENSKVYKLYIYDDVTAYGDFNWDTWEYDESETSANYFRQQLSEIPAGLLKRVLLFTICSNSIRRIRPVMSMGLRIPLPASFAWHAITSSWGLAHPC